MHDATIVSTSCKIRDQSSTHAEQMFHLTDRLPNGSRFPSRWFQDFDQDPERSSTLSVLVGDFPEQFSGTGKASDLEIKRYPESIARFGMSALSTEIAPTTQGIVVSHPVTQQLSSGHESIWHGPPGDFSSFVCNEADCWEMVRLYSQEMATSVLPPPRRRWIEGSTSCTTSYGDIMSNTVSIESERPLGQRSYTIPSCAEASAGAEKILECPPPLQLHKQSIHSPQQVAINASDPLLLYHRPARTNESDRVLPLSSSSLAETLERTMLPSLQPSTKRKRKSRLHSQTMVKDRVKDSAVVEELRDTIDVSMISGPRQQNSMQQKLHLSVSTSPDLHGGRQPGQRGTKLHFTSENPNHLNLKQKSLANPVPRKSRRGRIRNGIDLEPDGVDSEPTKPLDHVERERRRRDLMTTKVAALERLLPKSAKRDRRAVVDDTIQLLKKLERDVKDLQQRFHEAKLRRAGHKKSREPERPSIPKSIECNMETNGIVIKRMGTYMKPVAICTQPTRVTSRRSKLPHRLSAGTQLCLGGSNVVNKGNVVVEFHVHLDDTVTVQEKILKCTCRMDYLKTMIGVVEELQLDLTICNIMKLSGYFICIMHLKARTSADTMSASHFAARLQSAIDVDLAREAVKNQSTGYHNFRKHRKVKLHPTLD